MGLDAYGFPATHIANDILAGMNEFGTEARQLETKWYEWLHYNPFDVKVAKKLATILTDRIEQLDPANDGNSLQQLTRKLRLTESRAKRYGALLE